MKSLAEYMDRKGITQQGLAEQLGVSQQAVSLWLKGFKPTASMLVKLSKLTGISVDKLLGVK
jgi:transcriptional regulator with XRE-family HTH domain